MMRTSKRIQARFEALKRNILALGLVRPGCVVRRFMPCGNQTCRCMAQKPILHGPYHQWTHKIAGKTKTVRLTAQQARLCREWSSNYKRLKRLLRKMEQLSLKETDRILGAISHT